MGNLKLSVSLSSAALQYSFCCVLGYSLYTHEAAILDLEGRHWIDKRLSYNALTVTGCMEAGLPNIRCFYADPGPWSISSLTTGGDVGGVHNNGAGTNLTRDA